MKNTINNTNPVRAMMKPLPVSTSESNLKAEREAAVMAFLSGCQESVCSGDIVDNIGAFPGCETSPSEYSYAYGLKQRKIISTLKRLEVQGRIISTLYQYRRYYSIPVGGEQ